MQGFEDFCGVEDLCTGVQASSSGITNGFASHNYDIIESVISPNHESPLNQVPVDTLEETTTAPNQHIPIWSSNLCPSNFGSPQQYLSTANDGNHDWIFDDILEPPSWDPASQGIAQSPSYVKQGSQRRFISDLSLAEQLPADSITTANHQPASIFQSPHSTLYNDGFANTANGFAEFTSNTHWDGMTATNHQDYMGNVAQLPLPATPVVPDGLDDFTQNTMWNGPTMANPQLGMAGFNQLPFPMTDSMLAAPAPAPAQSTPTGDDVTAPVRRRPVARTVRPPRSHINNSAHSCDYPGCGQHFGRLGDLTRHKTTQHGPRQYPCLIHGCKYHGLKAFRRPDKLRAHQRNRHGMHL